MNENVRNFVQRDAFALNLGIRVTRAEAGQAAGTMVIGPEHLNSAGTVHGGAVYALADAVFAAASNSHGTLAMAIEVSMSYMKAVREGTLTAEAEEVSLNPKLATYVIPVKDEKGDLVALFKGTVYRKKTRIEELYAG